MLNLGTTSRLKRVVIKLFKGETVKLGAVGGSITWGFGIKKGHDEYLAQLAAWMQKAFPKASVSARNGGTPATTSAFMNLCYQNKVDADVDLLLVEYSINDHHTDNQEWQRQDETVQHFEQMLRKLLVNDQGKGAVGDPALVIVHSWRPCIAGTPSTSNEVSSYIASKTEQEYDVLLQYYSLPWVSLRNAVYHAAQRNMPGFTKDIFVHGLALLRISLCILSKAIWLY